MTLCFIAFYFLIAIQNFSIVFSRKMFENCSNFKNTDDNCHITNRSVPHVELQTAWGFGKLNAYCLFLSPIKIHLQFDFFWIGFFERVLKIEHILGVLEVFVGFKFPILEPSFRFSLDFNNQRKKNTMVIKSSDNYFNLPLRTLSMDLYGDRSWE